MNPRSTADRRALDTFKTAHSLSLVYNSPFKTGPRCPPSDVGKG